MTVSEEKRILRKRLRALEQSLPADYRERSARAIAAALSSMEAYRNADCVCCFVGTGAEIDTYPLLRDALSAGKRLCVPLCMGRGVMEMRLIASLEELSPGMMGIPEPPADTPIVPPSEIGLLITPCLAADRNGMRLGRGGGYYDRFLSQYRGAAVLLCRERLLQNRIPADAHDIPVRPVLSERGFYDTDSAGTLIL